MTTTPVRAGIALAITVGLFYALCTLVWVLAPGPLLGFMNSLFHGMNFRGMVQPTAFAWPGFVLAALVLTGWPLLAGTFFAWLLGRLAR